jgi:hypothetical protein
MIISGALNIDMNFKRLYELCLTGNNKLNESFNYFDGLYELCLEKKEKIDFTSIASKREKILSSYENEISLQKKIDIGKIKTMDLFKKNPEQYSNEYDSYVSLKNDSNEVSVFKKKNSNTWGVADKDGNVVDAASEEDAINSANEILVTQHPEIEDKVKRDLIETIQFPSNWKLDGVKIDNSGSIRYDVQKPLKEKNKYNELTVGISDINNFRQFDEFVVIKNINDLSEINNAIGELEKKLQKSVDDKNLLQRKLEPDFIHAKGMQLPNEIPERGYYKIATNPTPDGRILEYELDPNTTILPDVGKIEELDGEQVAMLEADRHNTRGSNMGGPLHPFLISNQAVASLPDGRGYRPIWANMNSAFVTRAKNVIKNTTSGFALIQIMKEKAHKSNRKFVQDVMSSIDAISSSIEQDRLDALHVILELGAKNPGKHLSQYKKLVKFLKDGIISESDFKEIVQENEIAENVKKYKPLMDFIEPLGKMKSKATRGDISGFDTSFDNHIKKFKKQEWYQEIVNKYKNKTFVKEASKFTFNQRGSAMDRIDGIPFIPSISESLKESMDFNNGMNLDIVAVVQLSKDMDAFAIYTGKDSRQESKMSQNEKYLRDEFLKNKQFKIHPSYDWMMLGPKDGRNFVLDTPVDATKLFPNYASSHLKSTVRNGSKETIVGTMKKSKIPLVIKI